MANLPISASPSFSPYGIRLPKSAEPKREFKAERRDWLFAIGFLLSMALVGLQFYPAWIFIFIFLINRLRKQREEFVIMLALLATSQGIVGNKVAAAIGDCLFSLSFLAMLFYRKDALTKKVLLVVLAYFAYMVFMAMFSDETLAVQFYMMRWVMGIAIFAFFLWIMAGADIDVDVVWRKLIVYFVVLSAFYAIDSFVLNGYLLIPTSFSTQFKGEGTWYHPNILPFSTMFPRKYPSGIWILQVAVFPIARYYKLNWKYWLIIMLGFATSRTMTVLAGFLVSYIIFQNGAGKTLRYLIFLFLGVWMLVYIDDSTGGFLRISSTFEQFTSLSDVQHDDDLAEFGSNRMAQVIPKYEALVDQNCLMQGFGFLHPEKTTAARYQINNDLYTDISQSEENVAITEVGPFNTVIYLGIIGLLVQIGVYVWIYFILRDARYKAFYLSTLIASWVMSLGGFAGLNLYAGLVWISLALAIVLKQHRAEAHRLAVERRKAEIAARPHLNQLHTPVTPS